MLIPKNRLKALCTNERLLQVLWIIFFFCSILFMSYIIIAFFSKPIRDWHSISDFSYPEASYPMLIHWIGGIIILLFGFFQIRSDIRKKYPIIHKWSGRIYIIGCNLASSGGLYYVFQNGTVGGTSMDIAFILYGMLLLLFSFTTFYFARQKDIARHEYFATITFSLGIGSLLYRIYIFPLFIWGNHMSKDAILLYLNIAAWLMMVPNIPIAMLYLKLQRENLIVYLNNNDEYNQFDN